MACTTNCNAATISRNYIYKSSWDLRHRTGWSGLTGVHGGTHNENFNQTFHDRIGLSMSSINASSRSASLGRIRWIGDIGVKVCKTGCHSSGSAFDLTAIKFAQTKVDMNLDWRSSRPLNKRRQYLAIWAGLRSYNTVVLTNAFNAAHECHMHIDNAGLAGTAAIDTSLKSDTTLVQTASNLLNGTSLAVDGVWGSGTATAYSNLLSAFDMSCTSPTTNLWHMLSFTWLISKTAMANTTAGTYTYSFC